MARPLRILAPSLLAVLALGAACSSGSDGAGSSSDAGGSSAGSDSSVARAPAAEDGVAEGAEPLTAAAVSHRNRPEPDPLQQQALIRRGNVELESHDVGEAQQEAQKVVDRYGGQVTEERTTTDDDGRPTYTRLVLRVPAADFASAVDQLRGVGDRATVNTTEQDVTTQLIDTRTRLEVQRRSIARITTLFRQAQSIRSIIAIEAQLSRRQADLDSLERQLAYLTNQTTLSTIVLTIDQIPPRTTQHDEDHSGFLAGLSTGWHGLTAFAVALATVLGALLPWLVVVVLLTPPALLLARLVRRRVHRARPDPA